MATRDTTTAHPFDTCASCERAFKSGVAYPVETRVRPDGELELYSFCDEECRQSWLV